VHVSLYELHADTRSNPYANSDRTLKGAEACHFAPKMAGYAQTFAYFSPLGPCIRDPKEGPNSADEQLQVPLQQYCWSIFFAGAAQGFDIYGRFRNEDAPARSSGIPNDKERALSQAKRFGISRAMSSRHEPSNRLHANSSSGASTREAPSEDRKGRCYRPWVCRSPSIPSSIGSGLYSAGLRY